MDDYYDITDEDEDFVLTYNQDNDTGEVYYTNRAGHIVDTDDGEDE